MLLVDVANVLGSRPDGWWRDRAGATRRLLVRLAAVAEELGGVVAVVEGAARAVTPPPGAPGAAHLRVVPAQADGDTTVAALSRAHPEATVVTADRGLRARLDAATPVRGPGWLLERAPEGSG